jgi:hypothetical protein
MLTLLQHSRVVVSHQHAVWTRPKVRKKFGTLVKAEATEIHDIMIASLPLLTEWIEGQVRR